MVYAQKVGLESTAKTIELVSAGTLTNLGFDKAYLPYIPSPVTSTNTLKSFSLSWELMLYYWQARKLKTKS